MTASEGHDWSPRQKQVLDLLARGQTNGQIAEALGITLDGAKWHVSEIIGKLDLDTREEAAEYWRQRQGLRARLRLLTRTGSAPALLRWLGIGGAATAAVVVVAVGGFMLLNGGDDEPASPDSSPTAGVTATATTPETGPTPVGSPQGSLDGVSAVPLKLGSPMPIPSGMVMYYNRACYACGPGLNLWRAYVDASGQLQDVPITADLVTVAPDGAVSWMDAIAPGPSEWFGTLCTGYCGGESEATYGSTKVAMFSYDRGVTWVQGKPVHVETTPVAPYRGDWLLRRWEDRTVRYSLYDSGESIDPPFPMTLPIATVDPDGRLTWRENSTDPHQPRFFEDGRRAPPSDYTARAYTSYDETSDKPVKVVVTGPADEVINVMTWFAGAWAGLLGMAEPGLLMGYGEIPYELYPPGTNLTPHMLSTHDVRAVFLTVDDATVHPIAGLPRGPEGANENRDFSYPSWVEFTGPARTPPLRVATGGSCLNVRDEPSTGAASLRCYADGVLLFERNVDAPDGWVAVTTPDGRDGWASAEFLER